MTTGKLRALLAESMQHGNPFRQTKTWELQQALPALLDRLEELEAQLKAKESK